MENNQNEERFNQAQAPDASVSGVFGHSWEILKRKFPELLLIVLVQILFSMPFGFGSMFFPGHYRIIHQRHVQLCLWHTGDDAGELRILLGVSESGEGRAFQGGLICFFVGIFPAGIWISLAFAAIYMVVSAEAKQQPVI